MKWAERIKYARRASRDNARLGALGPCVNEGENETPDCLGSRKTRDPCKQERNKGKTDHRHGVEQEGGRQLTWGKAVNLPDRRSRRTAKRKGCSGEGTKETSCHA